MMLVAALFLDGDGTGQTLPPFTADSTDAVHLSILTALTYAARATWSFALAIELINPPGIVADRRSFNAWRPTSQERQTLLEIMEAEELAALQNPRPH